MAEEPTRVARGEAIDPSSRIAFPVLQAAGRFWRDRAREGEGDPHRHLGGGEQPRPGGEDDCLPLAKTLRRQLERLLCPTRCDEQQG